MPTNIRMYNCAFGDCFNITHRENEEESHLYVDFGIHSRCGNAGNWRNVRYDDIINDIPEHADFLLTHYHYDHYSGLLRMISCHQKRFDNVYIPDVWGIAGSINTVTLLLLKDLLTRTVLERGMSLISFLISICHSNGRVFFVKRGDIIQDRYVALWPNEECVNQASGELMQHVRDVIDIPGELVNIANRLCECMRQIHEIGFRESTKQLIQELETLENQMVELAQNITAEPHLQKKLADFKHSINIIFQNHREEDRHILFTGDAEKVRWLWDEIEQNRDGMVPFYRRYDVIKVPHHGTGGHYRNFTGITDRNSVFLIPNGRIPLWSITEDYSIDANNQGSIVCCSCNDACLARALRCNCRRRNVIPNIYIDI